MDITGLTGHSGSGKTTVAQIMKSYGFYHINCDEIVHKLYTRKNVLDKIANTFGNDYITEGVLNRKKLGELIFSDKVQYNKLMTLVKSDIIAAVEKEIKENAKKHILLDAPTLFEFGMEGICTRIIAVISDKAIERICQRDGLDKNQAIKRLENQKNADFFRKNCHIVIENNEDLSVLEEEIHKVAQMILKG